MRNNKMLLVIAMLGLVGSSFIYAADDVGDGVDENRSCWSRLFCCSHHTVEQEAHAMAQMPAAWRTDMKKRSKVLLAEAAVAVTGVVMGLVAVHAMESRRYL